MEFNRKLAILADAAKYDASCASSGSNRKRPQKGLGNTEGMGICHSYTPDGRCISLLKLLLTNVCIWDCSYCINRRSSNVPRARFTPEEIVRLTVDFYKRNYIEGLFLSSGIIRNADHTMEMLVAVARKLREEEHFGGYIHLKAVPGASPELLAAAGRYADRLSANIEMPQQSDLDALAPEKRIAETESTMADIKSCIDEANGGQKAPKFAQAGQSTQIVVGAGKSSDAVILSKAQELYSNYKLRRVYYSAFSPAMYTDPSLNVLKAPLLREHRLYQADWLVRNYGFRAEEVTAGTANGDLELEHDPKLAWALRNRPVFPVDINTADRAMLARVPGFGMKNVDRILQIRRFKRVTLADLSRLKVSLNRARWFIIAAGHNPDVRHLDRLDLDLRMKKNIHQPSLFDLPSISAITGQL